MPGGGSAASIRAGSWFQCSIDTPSPSVRACPRESAETVEQYVASRPDLFFS